MLKQLKTELAAVHIQAFSKHYETAGFPPEEILELIEKTIKEDA